MQEDRIRRRREFCGEHKQQQQGRIKNCSERADAIEAEAFAPREDGDGDGRQQRTSERKFKCREFGCFDEEAAGAPKDGGAEDEK